MRTLNDYFIPFQINNVYIPVPDGGKVIKIATILNGAIGTANAVLTAKINGTAVTGGVVTIATASSAAGDLDSAVPTAANEVAEDGLLEIETNGASTNTIVVNGMITIRRQEFLQMHPYPIISVGAVAKTVTSSGSSAETTIPLDASGSTAKVVRITSNATAHVKAVLTGTAATANDIMVGPGDGIFLHVQGFTHIAYIQQASGSKVNIVPIEA